jgi:branched-chain amino acid transport system substrate-binding protein
MLRNRSLFRPAFAASAAALLALTACSSASSGGGGSSSGTSSGGGSGAYQIGMSMDLSGPISFNGKIAAAGLESYIKYLDSKGGVNGRQVNLQVLDDMSDIAHGRANVEQFTSNHDLAIFGFILTDLLPAVMPLAARAQTPVFGLGGPTSLFQPVQQYYWSYELAPGLRLPTAILNFISIKAKAAQIAKPRVAIFAVDTASNEDVVKAAAQEIAARGWTLASTQYMPISPTNLTAQAQAIKQSHPDFIMMSHNDAGALVAVRALRAQGVTVPVVNQGAGSSDSTFKALGQGYYALRTYASPTDTSIPAVEQMASTPAAKAYASSMTNSYFTQGWVAGQIFQQALEKCGAGCSSGSQLNDAMAKLGTVNTDGLSGQLTVDSSDHELVRDVQFYGLSAAGTVTAQTGWISAMSQS